MRGTKINLLETTKNNTIKFLVIDDFKDSDWFSIDNLRLDKINTKLDEVKLSFNSSGTPKKNIFRESQLVAEFQDLDILLEKDLYQFAYDEKEDYVDIYIENYNSNIKTFWDDDFLELYLTKNSGLKVG